MSQSISTVDDIIYKVNKIKNNKIDTIYVFNGGKDKNNNQIFNNNEIKTK